MTTAAVPSSASLADMLVSVRLVPHPFEKSFKRRVVSVGGVEFTPGPRETIENLEQRLRSVVLMVLAEKGE